MPAIALRPSISPASKDRQLVPYGTIRYVDDKTQARRNTNVREKRSPGQQTGVSQQVESKATFLAQSDIFQHLNPDEINELDRITTMITCSPGRVLYRPGETGTTVFLLRSGRVQLYHLSADGRKLITATLEAGACFGELPLAGQPTHHSFAEAIEASRVYLINRHDMELLLRRNADSMLALLRLIGQRFARIEEQLTDTAFKGTPARLAALLLQLACSHTQKDGKKTLVVEGLSHEELADRLGLYRETVSAALRELKDAGAIELGRKRITISRPSLLEEVASLGGKSGRV